MAQRRLGMVAAMVLAAAAGGAFAQQAATTAFTYQGRLTSGGVGLTALYDFQFRLFDAATGGTQLGSTIGLPNTQATGGLFTVGLDFGQQFNSQRRWLEIAVRNAGAGAFTTLTPRQEVTAAPHAEGLVLPISSVVNSSGDGLAIANSGGGNTISGTGAAGTFEGGVFGMSTGASSNGVIGIANNGTSAFGVWGQTSSGTGVQGTATGAGTTGVGGSGGAFGGNFSGGTGVQGSSTISGGFGVRGTGGPSNVGVLGESSSGGGASYGVQGTSTAPAGNGVRGEVSAPSNSYGVWGLDNTGSSGSFAGYFNGNVQVTGNLAKGGGSFKIDHPLDPANKYLYHSFVESPDMMNIYNGNAQLDGTGSATITMPDWFQTLNRDFRYQLTALGQPSPGLYIAQLMTNGQFVIAGGTPGGSVSWQVTGIRQDPWANAHRIPVEEMKRPEERGLYLHPELYGMPPSADLMTLKGVPAATPAPTPVATKGGKQ